VLTPFGYGTVRTFRETDGFYHLSLVGWQMKGPHPTAYFSGDSLSYGIAKGCVEGYPVYTSLGLTGILISVEPTTGVHVVSVVSVPHMVCYLQRTSVLGPVKAAVGECVLTPYGEGQVARHRPGRDGREKDVYEVRLEHWNALLYCGEEGFDCVAEGTSDTERFSMRRLLGLDWLLRGQGSGEGMAEPRNQRSRSGSVTSRGSQRSR